MTKETNVTDSSGGQPPPTLPLDGEVAERECDTPETNDVPSTSNNAMNDDSSVPLRRSSRVRNPPDYYGHR